MIHKTNYHQISVVSSPVDQEKCISIIETYPIVNASILRQYKKAAVATDNQVCSTVGRQIFERNGTTVDAAIATAICNGVISGHSMEIGGDCIMVIYSK